MQAAVATGLATQTVALRRRSAALRVLADTAATAEDAYRVLPADGVRLDPGTIAAARMHARAEGLAALDLVPRDLAVAQALDLLREVDPATYRGDRLTPGRGACHALLADEGVLKAAAISSSERSRTAGDVVAATVALKLHAPTGCDLVVAPRLVAHPRAAGRGAHVVAALHGPLTGNALAPRLVWMAVLLASCAAGRAWAAAILGAWSAQPLAVFAGSSSLRPIDLWSYSATRVLMEPRHAFATLRAARRHRAARADAVEIRRSAYQAQLAAGSERFFEPRRTSCPWCASPDLRPRLRTTDLLQHKPGRFTLEQCRRCGHVFQNPRLSAEGLSFYYRDFYDGLGEQLMDWLFASSGDAYRSRAEALKAFSTPHAWLDVGTGHGHFCNAARDIWPQTAFDGLDMAEGIATADRRGWVRRGYKGRFAELAPDLAGAYDVVSMFHYLEHTPDPQLELEAAWTALRPGGHLLIEVPDPQSRWSRLLGRWWIPWLQPQHLHLIPLANLRRRLRELGFTVVLERHVEPSVPLDLLAAALVALDAVAPRGDLPWLPRPPSRLSRLARTGVMAAGLPLLYAVGAAGKLIQPLGLRLGLRNAYTVVARKTA